MNEDSFINRNPWNRSRPPVQPKMQNIPHPITGPGGINPNLNIPSPQIQNNPHPITGPGGIDPRLQPSMQPQIQNNPHQVTGPGGIDPNLRPPIQPQIQDIPHDVTDQIPNQNAGNDPLSAYQNALNSLPQGKSKAPWGGTVTKTGNKVFWEGDNNTGAPVGFEMRKNPAKAGLQSAFVNSGMQNYLSKQLYGGGAAGDKKMNDWYAQQNGFQFDSLGNVTDGSPGMGTPVPQPTISPNQHSIDYSNAGQQNGSQPMASGGNNPVTLFGNDISGKGPRSYSGLEGQTKADLLKSLMPQMTGSINNIDKNINDYTNNAVGMYNSTARNALKEYMPQVIDRLSADGVLNSDIGQKALGDAMNQIATQAANKSYDAGMQGAKMKYQVPSMLNPILSNARSSESTNDLAPYSLLMQGINNMM